VKVPVALIAEDEPLLRHELREALASAWPELCICAEAADGDAAIRAMEQHGPDILFLDIRMPGASGLEVARRASGRSHVVFITAYDEFAVAAFEQGAVDYLLKPFSVERLATAVARLKQRLHEAPADLDATLRVLLQKLDHGRDCLRWITASRGRELYLTAVEEVLYFKADYKYTQMVTGSAEFLIRKTIRGLLEELDPDQFWQIHRSTLVNVNAIASVQHGLDGHLRLRVGERPELLVVSRPFAYRFRQL
jgi:DNA-binding LytR/AlgR family response regulator